ncbi:MAG: hypothetical protein R2940_07745 [Syntrophotaleaceae bacterium]
MEDEKIKVRITESGQTIEVLVLSKQADKIQVLLGAGADSIRCQLLPTPSGRAYAGSVMGREIVYERSRREVEGDIKQLQQERQKQRRR